MSQPMDGWIDGWIVCIINHESEENLVVTVSVHVTVRPFFAEPCIRKVLVLRTVANKATKATKQRQNHERDEAPKYEKSCP